MADLTYSVDVNTGPAQRNLDQLNKRVDKLNNTFAGLKSALAGLAIGAAISNVIRLADGIQDVSDATGMAVQNVLGFQKAVSLNGGTAEQATQSIYKLTQSIGEAADGSRKTQEAFGQVGVSINDLRTLSEQDILTKTVQGLAKIDDASKRAVLTTDLLGKSFRGINIQGVASQMQSATASSISMAKAVQQTADMQNKLDIATQKLQMSLLKAIQPLVEFINKMDDEKIGNMIEAIVKLSAAIAALAASVYVIEKLIKTFAILGAAFLATFASFKFGAALMTLGFASIGATAVKTVQVFSAWWRLTPRFAALGGRIGSLGKLFLELGARLRYAVTAFLAIGIALVRMFPFIAMVSGAFIALDQTLKALTSKSLFGWIDVGIDKLKEFFGLANTKIKDPREGLPGRGAPSEIANRDMAAATEKKNREVEDEAAKARGKIFQDHIGKLQQMQLEYSKLTSESENYSNQLRGDLQYQTSKLKMTEDEIEMADALRGETQRYLDLRNELDKKFSATNQELDQEIKKRKGLSNDEALASDLRIELLKEELAQIKTLGDQQYKNHIRNGKLIEDEIGIVQKLRFEENQRIASMERMTQAIEAQISRQQQLGDLMVSANDKMKDVKFEGAQAKRSPLEQQMAQIQEDARKAALEAGRAFSAGFEDSGDGLTSEKAQELANGLDQIAQKYKGIAEAQTLNLTASRTWEQGWKTAFDNYMDNATNAAQQAGQAFSSITRNMESAIDNFVETGKFSFKDFSRSIIQDLIKIELKAQATKVLGMLGGGGGIFSAIGSLFGFANGGTPPINRPSIVGEQGPELFMPKSAGTIIPNNKLGMGGDTQVSAPVTNNYITNNVSALDAKSVAQLFAENRKTLLGTVEMARKEMPYSNR
jgi:lambda family phage tail tape measure protein